MRSFAEEPDPSVVHVKTRAHPVAVLWRSKHLWRSGQRHPGDAREGVLDDLRLQRELAWICDVREHVAAPSPVPRAVSPVGRRGENFLGVSKSDAFAHAFDTGDDALTR